MSDPVAQTLPGDAYRTTDHEDQGLDVLLEQYRHKVRIPAWLTVYLDEVQALEDAAYDVLLKRIFDNASGAQLDALGRIVGEPRRSLDDTSFKIFIRARILINRSTGTAPQILAILALLSATTVLFNECFPAAMLLEFTAVPDRDVTLIATLLRQAKAGGCWLGVVAPPIVTSPNLAILFEMNSVGDANNASRAWGDANVTSTAYGLWSDGVYTPRVELPPWF